MKTKDIVHISLFTTLLAVCAWIYVPTTIPFTMQTFAIFLTMFVLGGKKGTSVIFIYLLLGLIGIPVFSGGTAGPGALLGATGGYMLGWVFLGILYWALEKIITNAKWMKTVVLLAGLASCYVFGTVWFINIYAKESMEFGAAFSVCVLPFVIPDLVKLALAYTVSKRIKKIIMKEAIGYA